jgi:hypothetical protein
MYQSVDRVVNISRVADGRGRHRTSTDRLTTALSTARGTVCGVNLEFRRMHHDAKSQEREGEVDTGDKDGGHGEYHPDAPHQGRVTRRLPLGRNPLRKAAVSRGSTAGMRGRTRVVKEVAHSWMALPRTRGRESRVGRGSR